MSSITAGQSLSFSTRLAVRWVGVRPPVSRGGTLGSEGLRDLPKVTGLRAAPSACSPASPSLSAGRALPCAPRKGFYSEQHGLK